MTSAGSGREGSAVEKKEYCAHCNLPITYAERDPGDDYTDSRWIHAGTGAEQCDSGSIAAPNKGPRRK